MAILKNRGNSLKNTKTLSLIKPTNLLTFSLLIILLINPKLIIISEVLTELNGIYSGAVIRPIVSVINTATNLYLNIINASIIQQENMRLKMELVELDRAKQLIDKLKLENIKLSQELNLVPQPSIKHVKAKLIYTTNSETEHIALIGAGKKQGIRLNQIVTTGEYLTGRIVTVSENFSKVLLLNDYNSRIPVKTSKAAVKAILIGNAKNGGNLIHIVSNQPPKIGEIVYTSGDGKYYPSDLPVARIEKIETKNIVVSSFYNLSQTEFINVLDIKNFDN